MDSKLLTAINIFAVPVFASQTTSLIAQGIQFPRGELRFMLKHAKIAIFTFAPEMPVIAHFLANLFHASFK